MISLDDGLLNRFTVRDIITRNSELAKVGAETPGEGANSDRSNAGKSLSLNPSTEYKQTGVKAQISKFSSELHSSGGRKSDMDVMSPSAVVSAGRNKDLIPTCIFNSSKSMELKPVHDRLISKTVRSDVSNKRIQDDNIVQNKDKNAPQLVATKTKDVQNCIDIKNKRLPSVTNPDLSKVIPTTSKPTDSSTVKSENVKNERHSKGTEVTQKLKKEDTNIVDNLGKILQTSKIKKDDENEKHSKGTEVTQKLKKEDTNIADNLGKLSQTKIKKDESEKYSKGTEVTQKLKKEDTNIADNLGKISQTKIKKDESEKYSKGTEVTQKLKKEDTNIADNLGKLSQTKIKKDESEKYSKGTEVMQKLKKEETNIADNLGKISQTIKIKKDDENEKHSKGTEVTQKLKKEDTNIADNLGKLSQTKIKKDESEKYSKGTEVTQKLKKEDTNIADNLGKISQTKIKKDESEKYSKGTEVRQKLKKEDTNIADNLGKISQTKIKKDESEKYSKGTEVMQKLKKEDTNIAGNLGKISQTKIKKDESEQYSKGTEVMQKLKKEDTNIADNLGKLSQTKIKKDESEKYSKGTEVTQKLKKEDTNIADNLGKISQTKIKKDESEKYSKGIEVTQKLKKEDTNTADNLGKISQTTKIKKDDENEKHSKGTEVTQKLKKDIADNLGKISQTAKIKKDENERHFKSMEVIQKIKKEDTNIADNLGKVSQTSKTKNDESEKNFKSTEVTQKLKKEDINIADNLGKISQTARIKKDDVKSGNVTKDTTVVRTQKENVQKVTGKKTSKDQDVTLNNVKTQKDSKKSEDAKTISEKDNVRGNKTSIVSLTNNNDKTIIKHRKDNVQDNKSDSVLDNKNVNKTEINRKSITQTKSPDKSSKDGAVVKGKTKDVSNVDNTDNNTKKLTKDNENFATDSAKCTAQDVASSIKPKKDTAQNDDKLPVTKEKRIDKNLITKDNLQKGVIKPDDNIQDKSQVKSKQVTENLDKITTVKSKDNKEDNKTCDNSKKNNLSDDNKRIEQNVIKIKDNKNLEKDRSTLNKSVENISVTRTEVEDKTAKNLDKSSISNHGKDKAQDDKMASTNSDKNVVSRDKTDKMVSVTFGRDGADKHAQDTKKEVLQDSLNKKHTQTNPNVTSDIKADQQTDLKNKQQDNKQNRVEDVSKDSSIKSQDSDIKTNQESKLDTVDMKCEKRIEFSKVDTCDRQQGKAPQALSNRENRPLSYPCDQYKDLSHLEQRSVSQQNLTTFDNSEVSCRRDDCTLSAVDYAKKRFQNVQQSVTLDDVIKPKPKVLDTEFKSRWEVKTNESELLSPTIPHPKSNIVQKYQKRGRHFSVSPENSHDYVPIRPFLTKGSVAERVLLFECCPQKALDRASTKSKSLLYNTWKSTTGDIQQKTQFWEVAGDRERLAGSVYIQKDKENIDQFSSTISKIQKSSGSPVHHIPQFFYPRGRPLLPFEIEARLKEIKAAFSAFTDEKVTKEEFGIIAKACCLPLYWKTPLFLAVAGERKSFVRCSTFLEYWKKLISVYHDEASQFVAVLTRSSRKYLLPDDFIPMLQDIIETHPGLTFLKEAAEFHSRYVHTVISRIYYCVNKSWSGKITVPELRKSNFLQIVSLIEKEEDINQIADYFSYEHFYVIYCKFWELDKDHDLFIDKMDLRRHNDGAISLKMIERIFSGAVTHGPVQKEGKMSYTDFVWFLLSEEDKRHPRSIEFWFRCMDLDGDGYLSMYEMEYFYEEQLQRMEVLGIETLPFKDCLCQMLDMIKPKIPGQISLSDLKRCKTTPLFFDTFFNLEKYLDHEQRDPFAAQREQDTDNGDMSDWDRYATEEYELLVAEEGSNGHADDLVYEDYDQDELSSGIHGISGSKTIQHNHHGLDDVDDLDVDDDDDDFGDSDLTYY